jgi:hypothetical protein
MTPPIIYVGLMLILIFFAPVIGLVATISIGILILILASGDIK